MENRSLYIKIAHWYYILGMTQDEIAKRLSTTRQKVNRIINSLPDMDIVSVQINGYEEGNVQYECALEEYFGLRRVVISEIYDEPSNFMPSLANTASQYLKEEIQSGMHIGVSWGKTLAATIANLSYWHRSECTVVQLAGAQNILDDKRLKSDEIARSLANKLDCSCYMLYAPVIVKHPDTKKMLMNEPVIQKSFDYMRQCDIALVGIGELNKDSTLCQRGYLTEGDVEALRKDGYIGDICMNPISLSGEWQDCPIRNRIVSANMDILSGIPNVVAIAGGVDKADAIIGCLSSKVVNTLIIDETTAQHIVKTLKLC